VAREVKGDHHHRWQLLGNDGRDEYLVAMTSPIVIIGAGGAGIIAAWKASLCGASVLLIERNGRTGTKILISGGGKCNITHAGDIESVLDAFTPSERRFLKPSFYRFSNDDVVKLLNDKGISTDTRENGRVFPMYGTAKDVMRAFNGLLDAEHIRVQLHTRVTGLHVADGAIRGVHTDNGDIPAGKVILATGGSSYPKTGTTGDGYRWAAAAGHTVVPVRPALAPIQIHPVLPRDWQGVAMRECNVSAVQSGRRIASWTGDLLFTHEGLSGPCALEISREAAAAQEKGPVHIVMDLFPDEEFDVLDQAFSRDITGHRQRSIGTILDAKMPNRLVEGFLTPLAIDPQTRGYVLTREARRSIVRKLKEWDLGQVVRIQIERGEVTAGGIALKEVDPQTMRSRIVRGLYACGEVLDIAGPIGGYNLQAAFSTGYVAGESAALDELRIKN
jgi:predicted Rossmann fold flavoprotein